MNTSSNSSGKSFGASGSGNRSQPSSAGTGISALVGQVQSDVGRIMGADDGQLQSYANQLQQCRTMRQNLDELDNEIYRLTQSLHGSLMSLQADQYVSEDLKNVGRVVLDFLPQAEGLSNHVRMRHINYIDQRSQSITVTMNEALGG